jgi:hypothetical protein
VSARLPGCTLILTQKLGTTNSLSTTLSRTELHCRYTVLPSAPRKVSVKHLTHYFKDTLLGMNWGNFVERYIANYVFAFINYFIAS